MIKFIIFIVFLFILVACKKADEQNFSRPLVIKNGLLYSDTLSTTPFTGRNKSHMRDMKIEYDVVNGKKEGDFIIYFPNNNIQMVGKMKENKNFGEWKYYYQDGSLQTSGFYDNDIPTGKWMWFNSNGKVIEEGNYLNGNREGEWKSYDSTGSINIIRIFKENKLTDSTKVN